MLDLQKDILIRVVDTETTGINKEDALVEIGYTDLIHHGGGEWSISDPVGFLINPGRPIPPETSAVHHLTDSHVADAPSADRVFGKINHPDVTHFAAHNAKFDRMFFGGGDTPWICTLKASYRSFPGAPRHNNQTIRYFLDLDSSPDFDPAKADPPHRAGPDAYVTAHILRFLLDNGIEIERLVEWCDIPAILPRMTFGKHAGTPWEEIPIDYLEWMTRQRDLDVDAKFTARHWIKKRQSS